MSNRLAPAWRSASWTSGSSVSRRSRSPGMKLCGCRNCATPWRSQRPRAASGEPGGGSGSRSTTVTACPSRASSNALPSPQMPPPMMRTCANACPRSGIARRGRPVQLRPLVEDVEAKTARALAAPDALPPAEPQERATVEPARELEGTLDDGTLARHFLLLDPERRFRLGRQPWIAAKERDGRRARPSRDLANSVQDAASCGVAREAPRGRPTSSSYLLRRFEREWLDFLAGTLAPARRASERPIAMACSRLLPFLPERPDLRVPAFRSRIAFSTLAEAFLPYARAMREILAGPTRAAISKELSSRHHRKVATHPP